VRIPHALMIAALLTTHCTLLAPSDEALMGGGKTGDAGDASDATDAGHAADASNDSPGSPGCGQITQSCMGPSSCCSGLWCVTAANICAPCQAAGSACPPGPMGNTACCSGSCVMNTCQ
jgi:hypothetical protein